ncbi:hypothetical protein B0J14DRAFT_603999 [Halenospora varia]|nr:hypothetical protein B0J14DRAFT_603999 [Halenospora varia]
MKFQNLLVFLPIGLSSALAHPAPPSSSPSIAPCNIRCRSGYHLYTPPSTGKCTCVPDSTKEICLTATTCVAGSQPVWDEKTSTCSCVPNKPDLCAEIMCIAEQHPVYNAETKTCNCEWIPGLEPGNPTTVREVPAVSTDCGDTVCISEMHGVFNTTTNQCQCEWIPGLEPGNSVDTREAEVEAEPTTIGSCRGIFCISEQHPVWNATSNRCECKWIPGLEPGVPTVSIRDEDLIVAKPKPTPIGHIKGGCQGIFCIATHTPWYNATSGKCECIPIDIKPIEKREEETKPTLITSTLATPTATHLPCESLKIYCECGDHYMHWDALKEQCACPACPAPPKPTPTRLPCENLKVYCACGDHVMHWDEKENRCACPTTECPKPTLTTVTVPPGPTVTLGCENLMIWCEGGDHKMHQNPVTKKCECPPIES